MISSIDARRFFPGCRLLGTALLAIASGAADAAVKSDFYLHPGDRVCFYGDSITEQRYYGMDVETFVRTRFPDLKVEFVNSGVGGDQVTGGWAGPIDERLERDVFPFRPTVVTIMLGMNDAHYHAFDAPTFDAYAGGYVHLIDSLQAHLPGVRILLIQPTPFDDVTFPPGFPGGYNAVLKRYAAYVKRLADERHLRCVDFMTPMLDVLERAQAENPALARQVIPKRIHPSAVGELLMAQALLEAWKAPPIVTSVALDAASSKVLDSVNATVTHLVSHDGTLAWDEQDDCLPFPILGLHEVGRFNTWWQFPPTERDWGALTFFTPAPKTDWSRTDPAAELIVRLSGFQEALNRQPLRVSGLAAGNYSLRIDGRTVGIFTAEQLSAGVNLAVYHTPMQDQAHRVLDLVWRQTAWRFFAWRGIQTQLSFDKEPAVRKAAHDLIAALEAQRETIVEQEYHAAVPDATRYEISPASQ